MSHPLPASLQAACAHPDSLFTLPEADLLRLVYKEFPQEIDRLKRAYSVRPRHPSTAPNTPSPSYILYQKNYDEVNRTLVALLTLRWIHTGQYEIFVGSQPPELRLSSSSFDWIRKFYAQVIKSPNDLYILITSVVINDLGKDPQLASDCRDLTGKDVATLNHDAVLLNACTTAQSLIPALAHFSAPQDRDKLIMGIKIGALFNFGQLAQAENAPACLSVFQTMEAPRHRHSFQLRFMEQLLDVAGAAGHLDWTCAKTLIQPVFNAYCDVYDACEGVMAGTLDVRSGYDLVLARRADRLHSTGFRLLHVEEDREDRALMRVLCMGSVTSPDTARRYEAAWRTLSNAIREALVNDLNIVGSKDEPAVQPTYMPALLCSVHDDQRALTCALGYLARVMGATKNLTDSTPVVVERSVLGVLKQYIENRDFDPTVLERVDVPDAAVTL
ncbi:hypothetical protein IFM46972_09031 [Aspergillus udagawae]|uniref:Uncharacterized protein n=1 Tax=Aspergillus udagawae TaxID=91492 RepID=A0A8E0QNW6_9EURO|nr:uncharacterized protein Aud_003901 [Aspergillus udagawae]GFF50374.1 hypothetical protein IFM46972_09031 [Aspergillus udagawae]GIC87517.1 hypothetical protein Aud_003901 [Aspergillus udagawae]